MGNISRGADLMIAIGCVAIVASAYGARRRVNLALAVEGGTPMERAGRAVESMDVAVMRATAAQLRKEGQTQLADALLKAVPMVEKLARARAAPTPIWPAGADPVMESYLRDPPTVLSQDDLMVSAWLRSEENGGPPFVVADLYPDRQVSRGLTPRERWLMAPYFPVVADLDAAIVFDAPKMVINGREERAPVGDNVHAVTLLIGDKPTIYFPHGPQSMLSRFWASVLAHELAHVSQVRVGLREEGVEAMARWGYVLSPVEVQARYYQRLVYADLLVRARAHFARLGPIPRFP